MSSSHLKIGKERFAPGERRRTQLEVASLYDYTALNIPIEVIRGKQSGPTLLICSTIHGDEINGVEIIKRLLQRSDLKRIKGTLIAVPVVNVFGFNNKSRYLPDRRDLNRSFPGSPSGSLTSRLAHIFMKEVVNKCTHCIDLHTGAIHRANLPQIRACLDDPETNELAREFGVRVIIHSQLRDGSLREAARKKNICTLVYEGGEALRFEEEAIQAGLKGCLSVMRKIGMLPVHKSTGHGKSVPNVFVAKESYWIRANHSGSFRTVRKVGDYVHKGDILAIISDPFGCEPYEVAAETTGVVIGMSAIPLVNKGDAMLHIATFKDSLKVKRAMKQFDEPIL